MSDPCPKCGQPWCRVERAAQNKASVPLYLRTFEREYDARNETIAERLDRDLLARGSFNHSHSSPDGPPTGERTEPLMPSVGDPYRSMPLPVTPQQVRRQRFLCAADLVWLFIGIVFTLLVRWWLFS